MERVPRSRADDDVGGVEGLDLFDGDLVVPVDDEIRTELGEELRENTRGRTSDNIDGK